MEPKKALLIVDIQNDFCPGGALSIPEGDKIIPVVNEYIRIFAGAGFPVLASRDWHPERTAHFKEFGGVWPVHCVRDSTGAQFHPALKLPKDAVLLYKGVGTEEDSYSAFQARNANGATLLSLLNIFGVNELYIAGLATDYCVRWSVLDALKEGFKAVVLLDAVRGVDLEPGDSAKALKEMAGAGARAMTLEEVRAGLRKQK